MSELSTLGDVIEADIRFARGGGRTFIAHQYVPYPFHVTKPHQLDPAFPELATLCLQSASGGLYRGDRLRLTMTTAPQAAAHVVSQAAAVVHTARQSIAVQADLTLAANSFLSLFTDPYVLFPGTHLEISSEIVIDPSAFSIVAEGFDRHDPRPDGRPFAQLRTRTCVRTPCGRLLADDESEVAGTDLVGAGGPLGPYQAFGSVMVLGRSASLDIAAMQTAIDAQGIASGASALPNEAGLQVKLLAADGGRLARGMWIVFAKAFEQRFGIAAVRMRR